MKMKGQWSLILAFLFAIIVALFAVINVEPVEVDYLFGTADWPLILIILGSVLMGGIIVASAGIFRLFVLQRKVKGLEKDNASLRAEIGKHNDKSDETEPTDVLEEKSDQTESNGRT
jgi:lipopolysaccharide assembly protein A